MSSSSGTPETDDEFVVPEPVPYKKGQTFIARKHTAPPPRGSYHYDNHPPFPSDWEELDPLNHCLSKDLVSEDTSGETRDITITRELSITDRHGAQVVAVGNGQVAKIFDPLYYPYPGDPRLQKGSVVSAEQDPIEQAITEYGREVASYEELGHWGGREVPHFYGSWLLEVPSTRVARIRKVRMILLEEIQGVCLADIDPSTLTPDEKNAIMIKTIKTEMEIDGIPRVKQNDVAPRNFICRGVDPCDRMESPSAARKRFSKQVRDPNLQVAIFDFGLSTVLRRTTLAVTPSVLSKAHRHPLLRWYGLDCWYEFEDDRYNWMPRGGKDRLKWLNTTFEGC